MTHTVFAIALAYLIGSIPFAVVVSWILRLPDPRTYGSSNPGATNVLRSGNKLAALLTLLGDAAKGWVAVMLLRELAPRFGLDPLVVAPVALFVFLGHVFPLWLGFKGGKGVATALGVLLGLHPWLALATAAIWLAVVLLSRYSSLGALAAAAFAPFATYYWFSWGHVTLAVALMSLILMWRHHPNIQKLMRGEENRIGETTCRRPIVSMPQPPHPRPDRGSTSLWRDAQPGPDNQQGEAAIEQDKHPPRQIQKE